MANFNPGLNPTSDPNYERSVKEINAGQFAEGMDNHRRERELNLFKSIGQTVDRAIEGGYETIRSGIQNDVYGATDAIRDSQGVGSAVLQQEAGAAKASSLGKPADTQAVYDSISRLHSAYEQGKIGDTPYYAQLEAMTRSIRSRFPGFREEVDAMVHQVTGITPANALRSSIENDLSRNASAQDALQKDWNHYEATYGKYFPADYWDRKQSGKPYSETETRAYVGRQMQEEHKVETAKAGLALQAEQGKVTTETAEQTARDGLATLGNKHMGQMLPLMNELIQRQKEGKALTPEEQTFVRGRFNEIKLAAEADYNKFFDDPLTKGSDKTLGGYVKDKRSGIIADHMKQFENIEKSLFDKDTGFLEATAQELKARQESGALDIQKKYPVIANLANLSKTLGPAGGEIIKQVMMTDTGLNQNLTSATKNIINGMGVALLTPGQPGSSPLTQIDDFIQGNPEGKKPAAIKALVGQWANIASNPSLPKETVEAAAKNLYGGESNKLLSRFNSASQLEVFRTLTSPAITENMKKTGGQAWENYSSWAKNAFTTVLRSAGDSVGKAPDSPFWKVSFNDKSNRFELAPTPEGIRFLNQKGQMATGFSVIDALSRFAGADVKASIDKINAGIERIEPVLKADGHSPAEEIKSLTGFMSKYDKNNPTFWQWIMKGAVPSEKPHAEETFGGVHPNFTQASGDNPGGLSLDDPTKAIDAVKSAFSKGESGDNYNRLVNTPTHPKEIGLTNMSIKDVLAYQQDMLDKGNKSSAAGKYQIVSKTLRSLVKEGVVSLDDKYDEQTQEKLADALLERRGLQAFLDGKMPLHRFMTSLGNEWEIIKKSPAAYHKTMYELERLRMASK